MKIRLWSDIHLEFGDMKFTPREDDHETILVIAGDFQVGTRSFDFLRFDICPRFRAVIYTTGNHEYYGEVIQHIDRELALLADEIENFHFLNPGYVIIDDVKFIGGIMWTDFNKGDPGVMMAAKYAMNDYNRIKWHYGGESYNKVIPNIILGINHKHREFICNEIDKEWSGKRVVVTHHPPLEECAKNKFYQSDDPLTFCYCNTGLEEWIAKCDYWLHGHIHNWSHIDFHGCQIIARPRGYNGHQIEAYQYDLTNKDAEIIDL